MLLEQPGGEGDKSQKRWIQQGRKLQNLLKIPFRPSFDSPLQVHREDIEEPNRRTMARAATTQQRDSGSFPGNFRRARPYRERPWPRTTSRPTLTVCKTNLRVIVQVLTLQRRS